MYQGAGKMVLGAGRFVPRCADTAGGWDDAAVETIAKCAAFIDVSRRGHDVVGIWMANAFGGATKGA